MFRKLCDAAGVTRIIAVATEAVRRAKNQRSFLDEIQANCGIKIRVLSAEEEAVLVYRGAPLKSYIITAEICSIT